MSARAPQALKKGDTVAIISPSGRQHDVIPWRLERASAFLKQEGYHVKIIHTLNLPKSPLSANVAARAAEVHSAFEDPSVKAIICAIGGDTVNELLPALNPEVIRKNPKILSGMSDNTLLHHFCFLNGLRTFYGPSALTQFGDWPKPISFTWDNFIKVTTIPKPIGSMPRSEEFTEEVSDRKLEPERIAAGTMSSRVMKPTKGWRWLKSGSGEGELMGGCLPSVIQLRGTKWEVSFQGAIAFIEIPKNFNVGLAGCYVTNMRLHGIFDQINGLIIGRPHSYSPSEEQEWDDAIVRSLEGYNFPVLAGVDVGHTDPMLTVPLGAKSRLDQAKDLWEVLEPGVSPAATSK